MKELLLLFTLCGTPHLIILQDAQGYASGSPSRVPQSGVERIKSIMKGKDRVMVTIALEDLTGLRCV